MALFSFITPQFESGAQNEVTMLWSDSPSSRLTIGRHSGDAWLLGKESSLSTSASAGARTGQEGSTGSTHDVIKKTKAKKNPNQSIPKISPPRGHSCVSQLWLHFERPHPRPRCQLPSIASLSPLQGTLFPQLHWHKKEQAKVAIIIGHYSNKGVSLFKLVHENLTRSKSHEPEKC